jgi:hypothetical protein
VLLFALIALVVMLIGAVALIRSTNTALFSSGNMAFRRELQNQAEQVVPDVLTLLKTGALANASARAQHNVSLNYSASVLPSNPQGLPTALLSRDDAVFATVGSTANDRTVGQNGSVTVRYLIDRLCRSVGDQAILGSDGCTVSPDSAAPSGGSASLQGQSAAFGSANAASAAAAVGATAASSASGAAGAGAVPPQIVYRLSVKVTGPRDTQAFFQTTFTL